jgi:hypothetical protein
MYYFFDDYGDCFAEKFFNTEEEACEYAEKISAEYFCTD